MDNYFNNFKFNEKPTNIIRNINNLELPDDYIEFMKKHNGGEGTIGNNSYGCFYKLEELESINKEYDVDNNWPGYIVIGSDLGGSLWAYNPSKKIYCQIDSSNIDEDTYYTTSDSLEEFIINMDN